MPKRINLTLSDEAAAVLAGLPFHSRGAYVSGLVLADRGRALELERVKHCRCGLALSSRVYADTGIWAASAGDIGAYKTRGAPEHDVIASTGKRLRKGTCSPN